MVEAKKNSEDDYKSIKLFIEEDIEETVDDLVRDNVMTATRYFQHRVKQFIKTIMMGKNNDMNIKYYTY